MCICINNLLHFLSFNRCSIAAYLQPFWDRGMTDLSSERGKRLVLEALAGNGNLTRNQIKVITLFFL